MERLRLGEKLSRSSIDPDAARMIALVRKHVPPTGITRELAKNVARLEYGDIPTELIDMTKMVVLEAAGCMVAGALQGSSRKVLRYVRGLEGRPDATCLYYGDRTNIHNAALVNGTFCHGARESVVIPATLASAEKEMANGHEVLTAIVLGWEVTLRLAAAAAPTVRLGRPFDPVATFGPFGAAVATGKIQRFKESDMENAITCCPAQAAGTLQTTVTGGESGTVVSGFAASYGVRAATMAGQGVSGARDMLEGRRGFFMCIAGLNDDGTPGFDVDKVNNRFGEKWYIKDAANKTSVEEVKARFRRDATSAGITNTKQERTVEIVNNFETQNDVNALISTLVLQGVATT
jgi:2-methylcitrate dehydratase PrpD